MHSLVVFHPNLSIQSINTQWVWIWTVALVFLRFISESQNDVLRSSHSRKFGISGLTGGQGGWLKTRQAFPIQSSGVEQVKRGQPACIWIGVRVRSGRPQSPVPAHRAGSASGWALACGGSCSYSRSEASCFSYSSSVKKKKCHWEGAGHRERCLGRSSKIWGQPLRAWPVKWSHEFTEHLGLGWLIQPNYFGLFQINLKILNRRKCFRERHLCILNAAMWMNSKSMSN